MGTDITVYAEKKCEDNKWVFLSLYEECYYSKKSDHDYNCQRCNGANKVPASLYKGRNYALFSILAGVRGSPRDRVFPIQGMPSDLSPEVMAEAYYLGENIHTHNWIKYSELNRFWTFLNAAVERGRIERKVVSYKKTIKDPLKLDKKLRELEEQQVEIAKELIAPSFPELQGRVREVKHETKDFFSTVLPVMRKAMKEPGVRDTRIVFWFDS